MVQPFNCVVYELCSELFIGTSIVGGWLKINSLTVKRSFLGDEVLLQVLDLFSHLFDEYLHLHRAARYFSIDRL